MNFVYIALFVQRRSPKLSNKANNISKNSNTRTTNKTNDKKNKTLAHNKTLKAI